MEAEPSPLGRLLSTVKKKGVLSDWAAAIPWAVCLTCFLEGDAGLGKCISLELAVARKQEDLSGATREACRGCGHCLVGNTSEDRVCSPEK